MVLVKNPMARPYDVVVPFFMILAWHTTNHEGKFVWFSKMLLEKWLEWQTHYKIGDIE